MSDADYQGHGRQKHSRPNFFELVYMTVRMVPKGRVTTYSAIAKYLGNPRGTRAVGWAMRSCPYADVPCQRVVRSDGWVSGHTADVKKRIASLRREKIKVSGRRVELDRYFFDDF